MDRMAINRPENLATRLRIPNQNILSTFWLLVQICERGSDHEAELQEEPGPRLKK